MIRIQKGSSELTVTRGAYKNFYSKMGYTPVAEAPTPENFEEEYTHLEEDSPVLEDPTQLRTDPEETAESEESLESEELDLSEIPLSDMTSDQLREYAEQLGIDPTEYPSRKELRKAIRNHLRT